MPDLGFLGRNLKTIFETGILEFASLQNFAEKQKCINLGAKLPYLGIFGLEF